MSLDDMMKEFDGSGAADSGAAPGSGTARQAKTLDDLVRESQPGLSENSVMFRPSRLRQAVNTALDLTGIPAAGRLLRGAMRQGAQLGDVAAGRVPLDDYVDRNLNLQSVSQPILDTTQLASMGAGLAKFGPAALAKATAYSALGGGAGQAALGPEAAQLGNQLADAGHPIIGGLVAGAPGMLGSAAGAMGTSVVNRVRGRQPLEGPLQSQVASQDRITPAQAARNARFEASTGQITPAQARMSLEGEITPNSASNFERKNFNGRGREVMASQMRQLGPEGNLGEIGKEMAADGRDPVAKDISEYGQSLRDLPGQAKGQVDEAFGKAREMLTNLPETAADKNLGINLRNGLREYMQKELNVPFVGRRPAPYNANMKLDRPTYDTLVTAYQQAGLAESPEELLTQRQNFSSSADRAFQAYEKGAPDREARVQTNAYKIYNDILDKHLGDNFPEFLPAWKQSNALASHVRSLPFKETAKTLQGANDASEVVRDLINGKENSLKSYKDAFGNFNPTAEGASKGLIVPGAAGAPGPSAQGGASAMQQLKEASLAELYRRSQDPEGNLNYAKLRNTWGQTFSPAMKQQLFTAAEIQSLDNLVLDAKGATAMQNYSYRANPSGTALLLQQLNKGKNPLSWAANLYDMIKEPLYYGPGKRMYMPKVVKPSPGAEAGFLAGQAGAAAGPNLQTGEDAAAKKEGWPYGPKRK